MTPLVTLDDTRSQNGGRGTPDKCFYCTASIGTEHDYECVCRNTKRVVTFEIEVVTDEPESWDDDAVLFRYNESSWCAGNIVDMLDNGPDCLCQLVKCVSVRDATQDEVDNWK